MNAPTVQSHLLHPSSELQLVPVDAAARSHQAHWRGPAKRAVRRSLHSHWLGQSYTRFPPSVAVIGQTPSKGFCITGIFPSTISFSRLVEWIHFLWRHMQYVTPKCRIVLIKQNTSYVYFSFITPTVHWAATHTTLRHLAYWRNSSSYVKQRATTVA